MLLLDPGLSHRAGHNAAVLEAIAEHASATPGFTVVCACATTFDATAFTDIVCDMRPVFRVNGYSGFVSDTESHEALLQSLLATCAEDLAQLDAAAFDMVLMPTAYPVHLAAVTRWLAAAPTVRFACGLLMPPRFWAGNARAAQWLEDLTRATLAALASRPRSVLYSEAPPHAIGAHAVATAMLLTPWSDASAAWAAAHTHVGETETAHPLRFGFFGAPTVPKGAQHLANLLATGLPADTSVAIALPEGHESIVSKWHGSTPGATARSLPRGHRHYLAAMGEVDVVLAFYDPAAYSQQMSGIVAEAAALGKPLLVAQGCDAIAGFLQTHAPGSAVALAFSDAGLLEGLSMPRAFWQARARAARAAAPGVQRQKRMSHYLQGIGVGPAP